ncbi:MAG: prolipoprotein diacylglyceryl transferase [Bacteroidales bacterium]|nr:prolipoprotein diacylglyceryl transferase [Bacteroidales bacterium]MBS3777009.1 prolipoprotein diacylglyceryl transferase [Bacteroidales bacterium]
MLSLFIRWDVDPELISLENVPILGELSIRYYGLLFAAGFVFGYLIFMRIFKTEGISIEVLDRLTLYMVIGTVLGARLGHVFFYQPDYYLSNPHEILYIWHGGLASHGAAIGILIALYLFVRKEKKPYIWILDRISIAVALAGFFIRMGNLMNSEIYGIETDLPWGFIFLRNNEILPKHPTQIYEALAYLIIFLVLYQLYFKNKGKFRPGLLFSLFMILIFTARFFIEFLKEVQVPFEQGMTLNMGQWLSLPFIILGVVLLYRTMKLSPPPGEAKNKTPGYKKS